MALPDRLSAGDVLAQMDSESAITGVLMRLRIALVLLPILFIFNAAFAVIAAKLPASKLYTARSPVLITKITSINGNRLELDVVETLSGKATDKLRLQIVKPESLLEAIKVGDPVVILVSKGRPNEPVVHNDAVVHMAGKWLLATGNLSASPPVWQVMSEHSNDFYKTFPGTTDVLIALLHQARSGKYNFLDKAEERLFLDGASEIAQLKVTPLALFAADLDGDKTPELLVSTPHGPHIFALSGQGYEDVTAKYNLPDSGRLLAVGDINEDGKIDLLIDSTPYFNQGTSFKPAAQIDVPKDGLVSIAGKPIVLSPSGQLSAGSETRSLWREATPPLTAAIGPFDEADKNSIIVIMDSALTRYSLDGRVSDFTRLTGEVLSSYLKDSGGKFKKPKLVPIDVNGDGRRDLLVIAEGAQFLLINRGFGAYFVSPVAGSLALGSAPDKPFPYASNATSSHWAAIDTRSDHHEDLLILTPDGALYRLGNPPPK
jgi:hypothetical protein